MLPVILGEVVEGHHPLPVVLEYVHRFRIPRPVASGERLTGPHRLGPARCVDHGPEKILRLALLPLRQPVQHVPHLVVPAPLLARLRPYLPYCAPDRRVAGAVDPATPPTRTRPTLGSPISGPTPPSSRLASRPAPPVAPPCPARALPSRRSRPPIRRRPQALQATLAPFLELRRPSRPQSPNRRLRQRCPLA